MATGFDLRSLCFVHCFSWCSPAELQVFVGAHEISRLNTGLAYFCQGRAVVVRGNNSSSRPVSRMRDARELSGLGLGKKLPLGFPKESLFC